MPLILLVAGCGTEVVQLGRACLADEASPACATLADRDAMTWLPRLEQTMPLDQTSIVVLRVRRVQVQREERVWRTECDAGDLDACFRLASCSKDLCSVTGVESAALNRQLCDEDHIWGCAGLATALLYGVGVERDRSAAMELFRKTCPANGFGCGELALHLWSAREGTAQDNLRMAWRACDKWGDPKACTHAACVAMTQGLDGPDGKTVQYLFDDACDEGGRIDFAACRKSDHDRCPSGAYPPPAPGSLGATDAPRE